MMTGTLTVKSVILTKLELTTIQRGVHISHKIETGIGGNLMPFKLYFQNQH